MKSKLIRAGVFFAIVGALLLAHYIWLGSKPVVSETARKGAGFSSAILPNGATAYQTANISVNKPVVVLVADMVLNSAVWDNTFNELSRATIPVMRYDLFGSGYSARPKGAYNADFFAAQLTNLTNKTLHGRDLILCGIGDGGAVVAAYAAANPGRVKKMVIIGSVGVGHEAPLRARLMALPAIGRYFGRMFGAGAAKSLVADSFSTTPAPAVLTRLETPAATKGFADALRSSFRHWKRSDNRQPFLAVAPKRIPTLILWGLHDKVTPHKGMAELHKILAHAETAVFENSGHAPVIDEPDVVHRRLLKFLQKKEG